MEISFNEVTTLLNGTIEEDIRAAAEYGFHCMEIRQEKLYAYRRAGHTAGDLKRLLKENGIRPVCYDAQHGFSFRHKQDMRTIRELCEMNCALLRELGIPNLEVVAAADVPGASAEEVHTETVRALSILSEIAEAYGVRLALEYMGLPANSVRTFSAALDIVRDTGKENVGLLVDTWHHYMGGAAPGDLLKARKEEIFVVHLSDIQPHTPFTAKRSECLFPGEGAIPIPEMLKALHTIGYDDFASVEVFSKEKKEAPLGELVRKAAESARGVFMKAELL